MIYLVAIMLVLVTVIGGFLGTKGLTDSEKSRVSDESEAFVETLSAYLSGEMDGARKGVRAMAGSPWLAPALTSGSNDDLENANSVLDRYNEALETAVCYLMNGTGGTIASSNRNSSSSFVGKNYAFRPYFTQAIAGQEGVYFALGVTSGTRGFYASFPVHNASGTIVGVAVMKKELDHVEARFRGHYDRCYFVSPEGIIFLSSNNDTLFKSLWPLSDEVQNSLSASKQFGDGPFRSVMEDEPANDEEMEIDGEDHLAVRKSINEEGWSIVLYSSLEHVKLYMTIGILITVFSLVLIAGFIVFVRTTSKTPTIHTHTAPDEKEN